MVVFANMDSKLEPWNEQHVGGTQYARFYELNSFVFSYLLAFRCIPVIFCFSGVSQETMCERLGPLYIVINIQKKLEALKRGKFMSGGGGVQVLETFLPKRKPSFEVLERNQLVNEARNPRTIILNPEESSACR